MVLFDIPFGFLAGGVIGWRAQGRRRDLALIYGGLGLGVPALAYLEVYPGWDWQYLLDPTAMPPGTGAIFVLLVLLAALIGHEVGARRPKVLAWLFGFLVLYLLVSLPRIIHVGDLASWQAGGGFRLPWHFLLFSAVLMGGSVAVFSVCLALAELSRRDPLSPRLEAIAEAVATTAMPPGERLREALDPADFRARLRKLVGGMAPEGQAGVRVAMAAFEGLAVLRHGRPFTRLDPATRLRWLTRWSESRFALFRLAARLILTIVKPCHIARRPVQAGMDYPADRLDAVEPVARLDYPAAQVVAHLSGDREVRCQVAVIGTGAGGAVVAAELAERGVDVVLLEEGRWITHEELGRNPLHTLVETYRDAGTTIALGRPGIPLPLGRSVGGTTTINSGTCFRVPERVLEKWDALGVGLDRAALAACYDRVEQRISVQTIGPELLGGSSHVIARGAEKLGLSHHPLRRNVKGCGRSGVCAFGCPRNAKQSMNVTYVPAALRAGATLYTGVRAEQVLVENGRAAGVRAHQNGSTLTVRADVVVSACGSISGPPFLMGSGVRSPHLGRHLTLHPAAKIAAMMPELVDGWQDTPQGYCIDDLAGEGILFEGAFVPPEYTSIAFPFVGDAFTRVMERYRHLAMFGFMVADQPGGRVRRGPGGRPLVTYDLADVDLEKIRKGLLLLSEVFFAAGAERIYLPLAGVEEQPSLDAARRALSGRISRWGLELAAFHPLGTARMATNRADGVLDPDLQSWEIPGLYVVDGGVFPTSLGVNPQLTIMAMATRAAEHLAGVV